PGRQKDTSPSVKLSRGGVAPAPRGTAAATPGARPATATRSTRAVVASRFHPMVVISSPRPQGAVRTKQAARPAVTPRGGVPHLRAAAPIGLPSGQQGKRGSGGDAEMSAVLRRAALLRWADAAARLCSRGVEGPIQRGPTLGRGLAARS